MEANHNPLKYNKSPNNATIHSDFRTLHNVVCLTAEVECGRLFENIQVEITIWRILEAIGNPQKTTRIKTDNKMTNSSVHASMRAKYSKA